MIPRIPFLLSFVSLVTAPLFAQTATTASSVASVATGRADRVTFPPPRMTFTISAGYFAHAGDPYRFVEPYYRDTKFYGGPGVRLDATFRSVGRLSIRASVARVTSHWELQGNGCGECANGAPTGLHTVFLTFYDLGVRVPLQVADGWPPDQLYADVAVGRVHQSQNVVSPYPIPGQHATNGTAALGLGGSYSIGGNFAFTLHVEDKLTRYTPIETLQTTKRISQNILTTAGITWQVF